MDASSSLSLSLPLLWCSQPGGWKEGKRRWHGMLVVASSLPPLLFCPPVAEGTALWHFLISTDAVRRGMLRIVDQKKVCSISSVSLFAVILRVERRLLRERGTVPSLFSLSYARNLSLWISLQHFPGIELRVLFCFPVCSLGSFSRSSTQTGHGRRTTCWEIHIGSTDRRGGNVWGKRR